MGMKNFSSAWIKGSTNQKISNVVDHATSEQHTTAMAQMQADVTLVENTNPILWE